MSRTTTPPNVVRIVLPVLVTGAAVASRLYLGAVATGIGLIAMGAAAATLGATLAWQSFKGYSDALRDADGLSANDRRTVRARLREERQDLGWGLVILVTSAAVATVAGGVLKELAPNGQTTMIALTIAGGAGLGVSGVLAHALWRLFFSLDDFHADVRDAVRERRAREATLTGIESDRDALHALVGDESLRWRPSSRQH